MKKRIYIDHGDLIINVNKKCFFTLFTEWTQLFGKHNWYSFTPVHIFYENDSMTFGHLFQVTLLGFSVSFRYNTDKALKLFKKWEKESKAIDWEELLSSQEKFDKATKKKAKKTKK